MSKVQVSIPNDLEVVITRVLNAPKALVYRAYTDPTLLPKWCTGPDGWTMPICEMPKATGPFRWVFKNSAGPEEMTVTGQVVEVNPPDSLVTTESWGPEWPETHNTVMLTAQGKQTLATLTIRYASKEMRDAGIQTGMTDGMEESYARLERLALTLV